MQDLDSELNGLHQYLARQGGIKRFTDHLAGLQSLTPDVTAAQGHIAVLESFGGPVDTVKATLILHAAHSELESQRDKIAELQRVVDDYRAKEPSTELRTLILKHLEDAVGAAMPEQAHVLIEAAKVLERLHTSAVLEIRQKR